MATLAPRPPAGTQDFSEAAVKYRAKGLVAGDIRSLADAPGQVAIYAALCGITQDQARDDLDGIAAAMDADDDRGLTAEDCRALLGWTPEFTERVLKEAANQRAASGALSAA